MRKIRIFKFSLLLVAVLFSLNAFGQDYTRWNLPEGATQRIGKGTVNDVAYSPDGTRLAVASSIGIWLYDTTTYQEIALLTGSAESVANVAFSPDGSTLASNSEYGSPRLWDAVTGAAGRVLQGDIGFAGDFGAAGLAFSPNGETLLVGSNLWDVQTGTIKYSLGSHDVNSIAFSSDGTIASGSWDGTIRLWNAATGAELRTLEGHKDFVTSLAFSPDGSLLASGSWDSTTRLWDVTTGAEVRAMQGDGHNDLAFSPDGAKLAGAGHSYRISIWEVATGEEALGLEGHTGIVESIAFSPDGLTIASGGRETGSVLLWDASTGAQLRSIEHSTRVRSVARSPDGLTLANVRWPGITRLWDADSVIEAPRTLEGAGSSGATSVAFSSDGSMVATGSWDGIHLWDASTGTQVQKLEGHTDRVNSVVFSPDGRMLASGSGSNADVDPPDDTVRLWDVKTGALLRTLTGHTEQVNSVAFSPDGRTLASGSGLANYFVETPDHTVRLWDVSTGMLVRILNAHSDAVTSVAFSPDGVLVSGSVDGIVNVWNIEDGGLVKTLHQAAAYGENLTFSPDGKTLASGYFETVRLWDVSTWREVQTLEGHTGSVIGTAFSADGLTLTTGSWDGTILLWDLTSTLTPSAPPYTPPDFSNSISLSAPDTVHSVAFSPDGATLATGNADNTVSLWWSGTGQLQRTLSGHEGRVRSVAFSPDGLTIASGSVDKTIRLWDADTGQFRRSLQHYGTVWNVSFSHDGTLLASGAEDARVRVWDVKTGRLRHTFFGHSTRVWSTAFSPDGSTLASGGQDPDIRLWDVQSGELLMTLSGHEDRVLSVAFSADGASLVSSSADATVRVWNLATGENTRTLSGHTDWVFSVAASSDGRLIASGGKDQSVRLWDIATGAHLDTLLGHTGWVRSVAISPDGMAIASGGYDNVINLWGETTPLDTSVTDDVAPPSGTVVSISPANIQSPAVGEQFSVSINITGGVNVQGYQITLTYDAAVLSLVGIANADYLQGSPFVEGPTSDPKVADGYVILGVVTLDAASDGDGTLATAMFEVLQARKGRTTFIGLSSVLSDNAAEPIPHSTEGSAVSDSATVDDAVADDVAPPNPSDVNGDGVVTIADLVLIAQNFGQTGANAADVNGDGVVDAQDFVLAAGAIDSAAAPSARHQGLGMLSANDVRRALAEARTLNLTDPVAQRGIRYLEGAPGGVDSERDCPVGELSESVQSRNVDTVSFGNGRSCQVVHL